MPHDGTSSGELQCRGNWIAATYYDDPRAGESFTDDGWLRTGDVATMDERGRIRLVDRTKDLIKSGGEWISSVELENELMAHPKIREAAVIGVPDPKWSERPLACVVLEDGRRRMTKQEVLDFLASKVAKWQLPDDVVFIDEVPKTSRRQVLQEDAARALRRRVAAGGPPMAEPSAAVVLHAITLAAREATAGPARRPGPRARRVRRRRGRQQRRWLRDAVGPDVDRGHGGARRRSPPGHVAAGQRPGLDPGRVGERLRPAERRLVRAGRADRRHRRAGVPALRHRRRPETGEGFESAVVYAVAEQLGFAEDAVTWIRTTFDEAIAPGPKDYDFNIQQYGITEERDEVVDFSLPYYNDQKALLVPGDSPAASATTFADIQDLKYGATIGTTDADYIIETIGIPEADVAIYDDQAATFAALDAGQIDATVIGLPTAIYITGVEMPQIAIAGLLPRVDEGDEGDMGMLFEESNPARDCVNTALQALTDDGTLAELEEQWMQSGGDIVEITE